VTGHHRDDPALGDHLDPEDMAVLAERGRLDPRAIEHLARCRSCMSTYADLVRYRAASLVFPDAFEQPEHHPSEHRGARRVAIGAAVAASAAVLLALAFAAGTFLRPLTPRDPISALLERSSGQGLVLPGGEPGAVGTTLAYRSGSASDEGVRAVEDLRARYEREPSQGRDLTRLAAGLLASGRLDLARDYIAEGLAATPQSSRLLTLAGIVAYRSGDYAQAERRLRDAVTASPADLTAALDLGLLLCERREPEPAKPYLERVSRRSPRSPLAQRARAALADCGRR
jgi:hypothetical protein